MVTVYITISTVVHIVARSCFCATRSVYLLLLTLQVMIPAAVGVCVFILVFSYSACGYSFYQTNLLFFMLTDLWLENGT